VGRHQQGGQIVAAAGQAQDQVGAGVSAAAEMLLLHSSEGAQALAQQASYGQQAEGIPAGMARARQQLKVVQQALT
jgi:hypothetical protein